MIKPLPRPDWYLWIDPPREWCASAAEIPGLQFVMLQGRMAVNFHVSHVPCLPVAIQEDYYNVETPLWQVEVLPFEKSGLLRPYQQEVLPFARRRKGFLLAWEMRTGKSPTACHLHNPADGVLVIVGPMAAREAWREWTDKVIGFPPALLTGRKDAAPMPGYPVYFCHYEILDAHVGFLGTLDIGTLVLDEIHMLQARGTKRMTAVHLLVPRAKKILGLSGTPLWNRTKSLWSLLNILAPGAWGTQHVFGVRYCDGQPGAYGWTFDGISNADELADRMAMIMSRHTWAALLPDLPSTTRVIETVEVTGAQLAGIEATAMEAALARGTVHQAAYEAKLRQKIAAVKLKQAAATAKQAAQDGHKVVLWTWHNEIGAKTMAALPTGWPAYRLQSSDDGLKRDAVVRAFREAAGPAFLVASIGVGGVALDLSCSDYAIFVELDWTPAMVQQAEMRTFHKDRPHAVTYLIADVDVENKVAQVLDIKNGFASALGLSASDVAKAVLL